MATNQEQITDAILDPTHRDPHGETTHRVMVYGTLKRGFPNHRLLASRPGHPDARFGGACALDGFEMRSYGGFPVITPTAEPSVVIGELWTVYDHHLHKLDGLEGHPDWYERQVHRVRLLEDEHGSPSADRPGVPAYVYVMPAARLHRAAPLVASGEWQPAAMARV